MSVRAITWAFDTKVGSATTKLVLLKLADYAGDEGFCWPSYKTLAEKTELSERTLKNHIAKLERMGLLTRNHRWDSEANMNKSNTYQLHVGVVVQEDHQGVNEIHGGGECAARGVVNEMHPEPSGGTVNEPNQGGFQEVSQARQVFDYWRERMGKANNTKFTNDRYHKIKARMDTDGFTVEDIKRAIDGCANDPFYMGQNDSRKMHNDIELICRSGSKVENFMELADQTNKRDEGGSRAAHRQPLGSKYV